MSIVKKVSLLAFALALSTLATGPRIWAAECSDNSTQWVYNGCCFTRTNTYTRYKQQTCVSGTWMDNGSVMCTGICME